jgi:hypothetical protein
VEESVLATDQQAAIAILRADVRPGDVILVKARGTAPGIADAARGGGSMPTRNDQSDGDAGALRRGGGAGVVSHHRGRGIPRRPVRYAARDQDVHRLKAGQPIADGPARHMVKRGTPTMGRVVFIVGTVIAYAMGHLVLFSLPRADRPGGTIILRSYCSATGVLRPRRFIDGYLRRSATASGSTSAAS